MVAFAGALWDRSEVKNLAILYHFTGSAGAARRERFMSYIPRGGDDDCWEWLGSRYAKGYGRFKLGTHVGAHRIAYALATGDEADGRVVRHQCDNPPCCNPAHLDAGTMADNSADMLARGRHKTNSLGGASNPAAKLGPLLPEIVRMFGEGMTNTAISAALGVSHAAIANARNGKTWGAETRALGWSPVQLNAGAVVAGGSDAD